MTAELPRCAVCRVQLEPGQNVVFRRDGRVTHVACPEVTCPVCARAIRPHDPIRRDGEAMLHSNCWIRRERAATKPSAKMMPEPDGITPVVRTKLMAGTLPRIEAGKVWSGLGRGLPCSACDRTITPTEIEDEVDVNGTSTLRFHRNCLRVWQSEVGCSRVR